MCIWIRSQSARPHLAMHRIAPQQSISINAVTADATAAAANAITMECNSDYAIEAITQFPFRQAKQERASQRKNNTHTFSSSETITRPFHSEMKFLFLVFRNRFFPISDLPSPTPQCRNDPTHSSPFESVIADSVPEQHRTCQPVCLFLCMRTCALYVCVCVFFAVEKF